MARLGCITSQPDAIALKRAVLRVMGKSCARKLPELSSRLESRRVVKSGYQPSSTPTEE